MIDIWAILQRIAGIDEPDDRMLDEERRAAFEAELLQGSQVKRVFVDLMMRRLLS